MARLAAFACVLIQVAAPLAQDSVARLLPDGNAVERSLAAGERHTYSVDIAVGESAVVTVEQRGIDVSVDILGPDGEPVAAIQDNLKTDGIERAVVVADTPRGIVVRVEPAQPRTGAGTYVIRVAARHAATPGDRAVRDAAVLRYQVARLLGKSKADEALPLATRALALVESASPQDEMAVAMAVRSLAETYAEKRSFNEAEAAYKRAIESLERQLGANDPLPAIVSGRLAAIYRRTGPPILAERLARGAIKTIESVLGPDHLAVAQCLMTLGSIRQDAGDVVEAEALARRGLAIVEKGGGTAQLKAALLNNLGIMAIDRKDFDAADDLLRRSVEAGEADYGPDSYWMANALLNLGIVARQRKAYDTAESYYLRALAIREKIVPPDHPDIAANLNNLATLYSSRGDPARALEMHRRALAIWEKAGGPYGSGTLTSLGNIARVYAAANDATNALAYQRRADAALEVQFALNLAVGSERQRLASAASIAERTDRTISLSLGLAARNPDASALAALVVLQRKGRVLDAMAETMASFRQRAGVEDRDLLEQLAEVTRNLSRLALNGRQAMTAEEHRSAIAALEQKKEGIEAAISEHNAEFRAHAAPVTLERVQAAIPVDAALIEFAVFHPFDPQAPTNAEAYGAPHYAAYVIAREGSPQAFDLGPTAAIDAAVERLRSALRDPSRHDVTVLARTVDALVLAPIRGAAGSASALLISPDGALNLIPFEALVGEDGRYALERYAISYLTSGRDLLRIAIPRAARDVPVVVANPTFGEAPAADPGPAAKAPRASGNVAAKLYFAPLDGTAEEARAIRAFYPDAKLLSRTGATKVALAGVRAPAILHIASHGFFLPDVGIDNPLLRSGLALAGANAAGAPAGSGLLTAMEAANLDLWGTKLVTLSACDTGLGAVRNGEGVYGLRRAFVLAGTETLVMSLWPISDYVTRQLMSGYYRGLKAGLGRGAALRGAQLALLARPGRRHPFYWASFIQAGDWRPMKGS